MLVVDASCLYEVLTGTAGAEAIRERLGSDSDHGAPHLIDVEVLNSIRHNLQLGRLDQTAASQAVEDLGDWPGARFAHRVLLDRAWELQGIVRTYDAMYISLAEALGATLLTTDTRLGRVHGLDCRIEVFSNP
jgi:predicted nucleic acid-binding protein